MQSLEQADVGQSRGRVLVVDDDVKLRGGLRRSLRAHGFTVQLAESAEAALERWTAGELQQVDVVVTDYTMGTLSGLDLLTWLGQHFPHVSRVLISGGPVPALQRSMEEGVVQAYLAKPFHPEALVLRMVRLMNNHGCLKRTAG